MFQCGIQANVTKTVSLDKIPPPCQLPKMNGHNVSDALNMQQWKTLTYVQVTFSFDIHATALLSSWINEWRHTNSRQVLIQDKYSQLRLWWRCDKALQLWLWTSISSLEKARLSLPSPSYTETRPDKAMALYFEFALSFNRPTWTSGDQQQFHGADEDHWSL